MRGSGDDIKTIFWDVGGVMLTNGWDVNQRTRVLGRLGVDLAAYEAIHDERNFFWERGLRSALWFFEQTVLDANPHITFAELWPQVCAESKVLYPDVLDMLAKLQQSGKYSMATLNNESRELNEYRLDAFHLRPLFDYFICSGYVHEMKPHLDIYRAAIEISGYPAHSALFIDDKQENCDAAIALDIQAIRFDSPAQLRKDLALFGIDG